jgi:asparagine synthase (glutamine-hydrolysing)
LLDSIEHHFVSDVPVGIFLSGGIDSTALVALATVAGRRNLHTFSISFPGLPEDEGPTARATARRFGTSHHEWALSAAEGREIFGHFLEALDQPSIDGLNTFAVSRLASSQGLKVVLSGLGGDELFGGYPSFRLVPRMALWHRRLNSTGPVARGLASLIANREAPRWRRLGDMLSGDPGEEQAYASLRAIFPRGDAARLTSEIAGTDFAPPVEHLRTLSAPTSADRVSTLEVERYMRNQLLRDSDVMSMATGLELRVPFLDVPLVEVLSRIPAAHRLQPGKRLLLDAVPEIPASVAIQPKRGFTFPFERWLEGEWREIFRETTTNSPVKCDNWYQSWSIFVLRWWLGRHCSGPRDVHA